MRQRQIDGHMSYLEVEDREQRLRDDVVEPNEKRRQLVPHAHQQAVLEHQLHVLPDVLVRHVQLRPALLELDRLHGPQPVLRQREVQAAHLDWTSRYLDKEYAFRCKLHLSYTKFNRGRSRLV